MMPRPLNPWDITPSLSEERLHLLGDFVLEICLKCYQLHDPAAGDGLWSLGCRTYQRVCNKLREHSATGQWPWLRAYRQRYDLEFSLMVGTELIRYFRGEADNPAQMQLIRAEEMHKRFGHLFDDPENAFTWFLVLDRDKATGRPIRVVVEQANSNGETRNSWIAATTESATPTPLSLEKPPVELGPPVITPIANGKKKSDTKE